MIERIRYQNPFPENDKGLTTSDNCRKSACNLWNWIRQMISIFSIVLALSGCGFLGSNNSSKTRPDITPLLPNDLTPISEISLIPPLTPLGRSSGKILFEQPSSRLVIIGFDETSNPVIKKEFEINDEGISFTPPCQTILIQDVGDLIFMDLNGDIYKRTRMDFNLDNKDDYMVSFAISPNCQLIAMDTRLTLDDTFQLHVISVDGTDLRRLTNLSDYHGIFGWSVDSKEIYFTRHPSDMDDYYSTEVYKANIDGSELVKLSKDWKYESLFSDLNFEDLDLEDTGFWWIEEAVLSPNGKTIALGIRKGSLLGPFVFISNSDGSNIKRITDFAVSDIVWSPDGKLIAFSKASEDWDCYDLFSEEMDPIYSFIGPCHDIYIMDVKSGRLKGLTSGAKDNKSPIWSPDGSRIAFVSTRDNVECTETSTNDQKFTIPCSEIYVMNADGSNPMRLTFNTEKEYIKYWLP